ncbi:MAG TPA: CoA-binding protein [Casimicrobium huifangae]|jgi:predicted CoA-binding protein|uniref:CoA-binding protein n=1 Tax=Casimicrobium huifangae TaxID=2591109 RepID=UPI002BFD1008|nr:CoA-binding protein [Casimicrobium huifangae]HQA33221.1 CoA-binding protein [Casimicrobium huifangae]HQD65693.1 CoA-binding protein [Casimicrobium huifangae]
MSEVSYDDLFTTAKTIAVVGLSDNPSRPSFEVAQVMQRAGFRIIPVNPRAAGQSILGEPCVGALSEIAVPVDIVDCFRRSEEMVEVARAVAAMSLKPKVLWMQIGVMNEEAAQIARNAGIAVVQNHCIKIEYRSWKAGQ